MPAAGQVFRRLGRGSCASAAKNSTCTLTLSAARAVFGDFTTAARAVGRRAVGGPLTSRGLPWSAGGRANGFRVTLRF